MNIPPLQDGEHTVVLAAPEHADKVGFQACRSGLEVRDCFSIQTPQGSQVGFLLRKPFEDTILAAAVRRGVATLDIDAGRISTSDSLGGGALNPESNAVASHEGYRRPWMVDPEALGRYPSNLLLVHGSDCKQIGTKQVGSGDRRKAVPTDSKPFDDGRGWNQHSMTLEGQTAPHSYGTEEVIDWECQSDCPVRLLDQQSGDLAPQGGQKKKDTTASAWFGGGSTDSTFYGDTGGASRFFYQATQIKEIEQYLQALTGTRPEKKDIDDDN